MKSVFITYDQAHHEAVMDLLKTSSCRGYTLFGEVGGCGTATGEPHLGSHAWPTMNGAVMTVVEDHRVDPLLERLHRLDVDNPLLGLRAFVWSIEKTV